MLRRIILCMVYTILIQFVFCFGLGYGIATYLRSRTANREEAQQALDDDWIPWSRRHSVMFVLGCFAVAFGGTVFGTLPGTAPEPSARRVLRPIGEEPSTRREKVALAGKVVLVAAVTGLCGTGMWFEYQRIHGGLTRPTEGPSSGPPTPAPTPTNAAPAERPPDLSQAARPADGLPGHWVYKDKRGTSHIVDAYDKVPPEYRY